MKLFYTFPLAALMMMLQACHQPVPDDKAENKYSLSAKNEAGQYRLVVEIPAGTNTKIEYDTDSLIFKADTKNGQTRIISFLPYPGNYGFIPGTLSDRARGGDGDPIDVLLISSSLETGTVLPIIPVAMLKLLDNGEEDFKVLAVPAAVSLNVLGSESLEILEHRGDALRHIVESWFQNYDIDSAQVLGWAGREETIEYIERHIPR